MIHMQRPAEPGSFEEDCRDARDAVAEAIHRASNDDDVSIDFPDRWKSYKDEFSRAQHYKCAFCEANVMASQDGHVDHYRPKARIQRLEDPGAERPHLANVRGRRCAIERRRGYWWSAYRWENFLLACNNCNSKWKRDLFPVRGARALADGDPEEPLLLNPFDADAPEEHLDFDELGVALPWAGSEQGKATIETCGLDRPSLGFARLEKARRAHRLADELINALRDDDQDALQTALADILESGRDEYPFAGVVRAVVAHRCGLAWSDVQELGA